MATVEKKKILLYRMMGPATFDTSPKRNEMKLIPPHTPPTHEQTARCLEALTEMLFRMDVNDGHVESLQSFFTFSSYVSDVRIALTDAGYKIEE